MRRNQQGADGPKDRTQLLRYAIFYLVVAAILLVTNQAAKNPMAGRNQSQSTSNLHIDLSVARKLEPNRLGTNAAGEERTFRFGSRIREPEQLRRASLAIITDCAVNKAPEDSRYRLSCLFGLLETSHPRN